MKLDSKNIFLCDAGDISLVKESLEERKCNIEIQAFVFPNVLDGDMAERIKRYREDLKGFGGMISIHGPIFELTFASLEPRIIELTKSRYMQAFQIASLLDAKYVNFHTEYNSQLRTEKYDSRWFKKNLENWEEFIEFARKNDMIITLENAFDSTPFPLYKLMSNIDSPNFRVALDLGHVNIYSQVPAEEWITVLAQYISNIHIHDNNGEWDQHRALGAGNIDFPGIFNALKENNIDPLLTFELESPEDLKNAFDYLEKIEA